MKKVKITKFRAWDRFTNKWQNQDETDDFCFINGLVICYNSDRFILEQYTGMKDKKCKEIYVGDILSHQMYVPEGVVVEDLESFYSRKADVSRYGWDKHEHYGFEIIGNVHKEFL